MCASGCPHPTRKDGTPKHAAYSKCPSCGGETRPLSLDDVREQLFDLIRRTPHLQWLLLTKRIESVMSCLPKDWGTEGWPNVSIGTSVENQHWADARIPVLRKIPAAQILILRAGCGADRFQ